MGNGTFTARGFRRALGPGVVFAGAAIGVSHVVQSTRAGAEFGFLLVGLILLANVLKYPFFEYGTRYAASTGESLLDGYRRLGWWAVALYLLLTVLTMFAIQAGVTAVAAALAENLFGLGWSLTAWSALLLGLIATLLILGHYRWLDGTLKVMMAVLVLATLAAVLLAAADGPAAAPDFERPSIATAASFAFIIALLGWMPANMELSVWQSLWTTERARQTGYRPSLREALTDFHLGYWVTTVYALLFVALGALVMYGTGEGFADGSVGFSAQLVGLFTASLGDWTWPLIATVAFFAMFSTTLAVTDAYPRVWRRGIEMIAPESRRLHHGLYWGMLLLVGGGALAVIHFFGASLTGLVDMAATLSFVTAPVFAWLNYRAVTHHEVPEEARPGALLRAQSLLGLLFLAVFAVGYLGWRLL
ncbi:MAG: Nramp family divalent metal transporter [Thiohalospira sp.]